MFKKSDKKKAPAPDEASNLHQDLIIHNMPVPTRSGGGMSGTVLSTGFASAGPSETGAHQSKMVGLVIMGAGLVLIAGMIYLGYRYMIKPAAEPAPVSTVQPQEDTDSAADNLVDQEIITATSTDLSGENAAEVATTTPTSEIATSTDAVAAEETAVPVKAADSDNDGLSDPEESVFATDPLLADSDGDSYSDATEIKGGYNPKGSGRLEGVLARYSNATYGYELSVPALWPKQELSSGSAVIFSAPDGSLIQISAQENSDRQSILSWYEEAFPLSELSYDRLKSGSGWEGIMADDGQNFYLTNQDHGRIIVISYISPNNSFSYPFLFDLVINSLSLQ